MLKHGEVNPLNVFGLRRLDYCPPHFERVAFDSFVSEKHVSDWVYENLLGRFYVGYQDQSQGNKLVVRQMVLGFELPSEASYFGLLLPQINIQPIW